MVVPFPYAMSRGNPRTQRADQIIARVSRMLPKYFPVCLVLRGGTLEWEI